jgi:tetratricopeptide (TPR) repeat protein
MKCAGVVVSSLALTAALLLCGCAAWRASPPAATDNPDVRLAEARRHVEKAQYLQDHGREREAVDEYVVALKTYHDLPVAWYNLGVLLQGQKKYAESVEALQVAADMDVSDPRAYTALGIGAQDLGWIEDAARYYDKALERNPNYLRALKKSVEVGQLLDRYDDRMLDRCHRALLQETDPKWVDYLKRMQLKAQERVARAGGSAGR